MNRPLVGIFPQIKQRACSQAKVFCLHLLVSRQAHDRKGCIIAQQFSVLHSKSPSSSCIAVFCYVFAQWFGETCEMVHHFELVCDNAIFHSSLGDFTGATQDVNSFIRPDSHRFVVYCEKGAPS